MQQSCSGSCRTLSAVVAHGRLASSSAVRARLGNAARRLACSLRAQTRCANATTFALLTAFRMTNKAFVVYLFATAHEHRLTNGSEKHRTLEAIDLILLRESVKQPLIVVFEDCIGRTSQ